MSNFRMGVRDAAGMSSSKGTPARLARTGRGALSGAGRYPRVALLAFAVCACTTLGEQNPFQFDRAPLLGMVYDGDNGACAGAQVTVDGRAVVAADVNGRFVIPDLTRGVHVVALAAEGYEPVEVKVQFFSRSQVLYLKMFSLDQLVEAAAHAVDASEWAQARKLLARASALRAGDPRVDYLSAVVLFRTGHHREAGAALQGLIDTGCDEPYIYLFLADLLEYHLDRVKEAAQALSSFLEREEDPAVRRRLEGLQAANGTR